MTFYESNVFEGAVSKIKKMPILNKTFRNPIFTAVIITFIIMIIIFIVFIDVETDDDDVTVTKLTLKSGFYAFITTTMFIFINNFFLQEKIQSEQKEGAFEEIFGSFNNDPTNEGILPIN